MMKLLIISIILFTGCTNTNLERQAHTCELKKFFVDEGKLFDRNGFQKTPLKGGTSGAQLYKFSDGVENYVLRDISHRSKEDRIREINAQKIASENGYGAKLHAYDVLRGNFIISFLKDSYKPKDRYGEMVRLVESIRRMHKGPAFCRHISIIEQIKALDAKIISYPQVIDKNKVSNLLNQLSSLALYPKSSTHRDLNPNNIFFTNNGVKFIDFENAGLDDPFFDIATVIIFYQYDQGMENEFLKLYFGREVSKEERNHLKLMKKAVSLFYGLTLLSKMAQPVKEIDTKTLNLTTMLNKISQGSLSLETEALSLAFLYEAINTN